MSRQAAALEEFAEAHEEIGQGTQTEALGHFRQASDEILKAQHRLWLAAAEVQETRAWEADELFMNKVAAGRVAPGEGETWFTVFLREQWGYETSRAKQLARAGRVIRVLSEGEAQTVPPLPTSEWTLRPLTLVLLRPRDGAERVRQVWEMATDLANDDPNASTPNNSHVRRAIQRIGIKVGGKKPPTPLDEDTARQVKRARAVITWLLRHEATTALNDLLAWIDEAVAEFNRS